MNKFVILNFSLLWIFLNLCIGFIVFLILINNNYSEEIIIDPNSKFIVVATGGSNRILEGINIFNKYKNMKMLITGVGEGITRSDIAKAILANKKQINFLNCCVDLGNSALNTKGPVKPKLDPVKDIFIPSNFIIVFREYLKFLITKFQI